MERKLTMAEAALVHAINMTRDDITKSAYAKIGQALDNLFAEHDATVAAIRKVEGGKK